MNRKQNAFAIALTGVALGMGGQAALAQNASVIAQGNTSFTAGETVVAQNQTYVDVMAQLEASGYEVIEVSRTWLGRVKIEARNQLHLREVVVSNNTGEVLSDVVVAVFAQADGEAALEGEGTVGEGGAVTGDTGLNVGVDINLGASGGAGGSSSGGSGGGSATGGLSISIGN